MYDDSCFKYQKKFSDVNSPLNTEILRNKLEANNRLRVRISIKVGQKIVERFGTDAVLAMTVLRDTRSAISIINEDILKATVDSLELVEE